MDMISSRKIQLPVWIITFTIPSHLQWAMISALNFFYYYTEINIFRKWIDFCRWNKILWPLKHNHFPFGLIYLNHQLKCWSRNSFVAIWAMIYFRLFGTGKGFGIVSTFVFVFDDGFAVLITVKDESILFDVFNIWIFLLKIITTK